MYVFGGSQPSGMVEDELQTGGAVFDTTLRTWTVLPDPLIGSREMAGAGFGDGIYAVWGGKGGLRASSDPQGFELFNDGAVYSVADDRWVEMPPGPLDSRLEANLLVTEEHVLVWGGKSRPGSLDGYARGTAVFELSTMTWNEVPDPGKGAVVEADGLLFFGQSQVARYEPLRSEWVHVSNGPENMTVPDVAFPVGEGTVAVFQGAAVWLYDTETEAFSRLPQAPITEVTLAGVSNVGIVVWDENVPAVGVYDATAESWVEYEIPRNLTARDGASACLGPTTLTIWGGWRTTASATIGEDTGFVLLLDNPTED